MGHVHPEQSDEERQAFENLVLMCANHHTVIDDAFESYTAARLKKLKDEHEKGNANGKEPITEDVNKLLQTINGTFIGPTVITQGQIGGQVAIKIENYGLRPRQITQASGNTLISQLQKHSHEGFHIQYVGDDHEFLDLAETLQAVLVDARWDSLGMAEVNR